ncbi:AAA family ATPase [Dehalobacter sp. DCM]|uniref:AAA family ATPase n=1 Tax=Dehalobacter sp. DCM TaxID=2907827 RepID=UPI00308212DC|nr:AAA family ATPase [Dehalobacter sp. DCM]
MLKGIQLENFKAHKNTRLEFSKFNVLTGYNSAGKTSVLQSLVFLKQSLSRKEIVYNDYLLKLGDFREIVQTHDTSLPVGINVILQEETDMLGYNVKLTEDGTAEDFFVNGDRAWWWDSKAPHVMEPSGRLFLQQAASGFGGGEYSNFEPAYRQTVGAYQKKVAEWFENMLYLSSNRGFTKYSYPLLAGSPSPDEVAKRAGDPSLLEEWLSNLILYRINEAKRYPAMRKQLDLMTERLSRLGVNINPYVMGGPSVVIDLTENDMWISAVNSGYGINQLVSSITLGTLLPAGTLVMIEEPEIHLHPAMQRIVCEIFADIANEGKQVMITSHSDHFLQTLRKLVLKGSLAEDDVKVYHFAKDGRETKPREIGITQEDALREIF